MQKKQIWERMNAKEIRAYFLAQVHVIEQMAGRKLTAQERARFRGSFRTGSRGPVAVTSSWGLIWFQFFIRSGRVVFRQGISQEAAANGCIERGKRWLESADAASRQVAAAQGRKAMPPIEYLLIIIEPDGITAKEYIDKRAHNGG